MAPHPKISGVLFDMDGLLIDSERIYTEVTNSVLKPHGLEFTWEIKAGIMGRPAPDAAKYLIEATGLKMTVEQLLGIMDGRVEEAFKHVKALPGAVKLVEHLEKHKVPMAIATGSKSKNLAIKSSHLPELFTPFGPRIICGDDPILEGKGKPDPTIFIEGAKRFLGVDDAEGRKKVLVFEDGAPGVRAARAAGMEVIWVPDPELLNVMGDDHDLDPSHTYVSLEDFKPEDWGLPSYDA